MLEITPELLDSLSEEELRWLDRATARLQFLEDKEACEKSLHEFVRQSWHVIEPSQQFVDGWVIDAICMHLEAVTDGCFNRLVVNVPPGFSKSLLTSVFWPAWEWGPRNNPQKRYLATSHSQNLAIRDSLRMRRLITSQWYQERWGDRVCLTSDQSAKTKFENTFTGFREATAFTSLTGVRADTVILDDPHSVDSAMSDAMREATITTFLEALPTRLNNPDRSAIVIIMQRLHQEDVSGIILEKNLGYEHLMLPMEFDPNRKCYTSIGFEDPRHEDGELLFPERFPFEVVERDKQVLGPYAYASQMQQSPSPRGGGIIKREWWQLYDDEAAQAAGKPGSNKYPDFDYIVASLDPAYTSKQENDPSALTVWGVWQRGGSYARRILSRSGDVTEVLDDRDTIPSLMLMYSFAKRLTLHGPGVERFPDESEFDFKRREKDNWGLCEHVADVCNRYNVDVLLVEAKASGISVAQELKRLNKTAKWTVQLVNPGAQDKVARAYAVQPVFSNGTVWAPNKVWAEEVITQFEQFPKAKHDDIVDSTTQALRYLRERGFLRRSDEIVAEIKNEASYQPPSAPVYDV